MEESVLKIIPFVILGLVIIFGGHYFVYRMLVASFGLVNPAGRTALGLGLGFLTFSFVLASILTRTLHGTFVQLYYFLSAAWMGIFINLLLASFLVWLAFKILSGFKINFSAVWVGAVLFLAAILFSAYGFWNAWHPKIKNIDISLKNLPSAWQGKKIVQLSDVHLGQIHGQDFLRDLIAQVNAQQPDLVLITGDLFDGMDGDLKVFVELLNEIKAKRNVYFVAGNHEVFLGKETAANILSQTEMIILNNQLVEIDGLQLAAIGYPMAIDARSFVGKSSQIKDILDSLKIDPAKPSILMKHAPTDIEPIKNSGLNLMLSGHTHRGQLWPFSFITGLIYGKYDYGLNTDNDFSIYTTNGVGTWGPPMRTGNSPEIIVITLRSK